MTRSTLKPSALCSVAAALFLATPARAQSHRLVTPARALSAEQGLVTPCTRRTTDVVLQTAAGVMGAWALGVAAWSVYDDPYASDRKVKGDAGYQPNANTAYALGSWVGSTAGVYGIGKLLKPGCGSLTRTTIGTGVVSVLLLLGREEPYLPVIGVVFAAPLQAIGGTLMFNR